MNRFPVGSADVRLKCPLNSYINSSTIGRQRYTTLNMHLHNEPLRSDVIIIGGGISGLSTATTLQQNAPKPLNISILESRNRLGGRIHTYTGSDDQLYPIDLGASFVHGVFGNPLTDLLHSIGVELEKGDFNWKIFRFKEGTIPDEKAIRIGGAVMETFFDTSREMSRNASEDSEDTLSLGDVIYGKHSLIKQMLEDKQDIKDAFHASRSLSGWTGADLEEVSSVSILLF